jgi:protein-L-isoaspartate(D-aspartate) O-methyltransferase
MERDEHTAERLRMVDEQLRERDITDARVLEVMRSVPRHAFVPSEVQHLAYADAPLPIGYRQTISQPYIVALMTQLCELSPSACVLEIGTGSGYQAAVLARLARRVYTIERLPELARGARSALGALGIDNVTVVEGDGSLGLAEHAPYDAVVVAAAAPRVPAALKEQLTEGGVLVLPIGGRDGQILERWRRCGADFRRERVTAVAFVPLVGAQGWPVSEDDEAN